MEGIKKGTESSEPNYDDCGNPIVNFSLHPDVEDSESSIPVPPAAIQNIPTGPEAVQEGPKVIISKNTTDALELLETACGRSGITCSLQMKNQFKTLGKSESISEDNIVWYVRGIIMANQSMILPSVTEAISELRSETRHLMNVSGQVSKTCVNLEKTSKLLASSIEDSTRSIKESFEKTLKHVAASYEVSVQPQSVKVIEPVTIIVPAEEPTKPVAIEAPKGPSTVAIASTSSVASIDKVLDDKKRLLILIGISEKIMTALTDQNINAMVTNDLYAETLKIKMTPPIKVALKNIVMSNLTDHLNQLEKAGKSSA